MADTWSEVEYVAARGGTWAADKIGPRRMVITARTLTGMQVEIVVPEAAARWMHACMSDIVTKWRAEDSVSDE